MRRSDLPGSQSNESIRRSTFLTASHNMHIFALPISVLVTTARKWCAFLCDFGAQNRPKKMLYIDSQMIKRCASGSERRKKGLGCPFSDCFSDSAVNIIATVLKWFAGCADAAFFGKVIVFIVGVTDLTSTLRASSATSFFYLIRRLYNQIKRNHW